MHVYWCRGNNLWEETHNHTFSVMFFFDGQKDEHGDSYKGKKGNAVIWDNALRNPILRPTRTLQFAFSAFAFESNLSDVDGVNPIPLPADRHALIPLHKHVFLLLFNKYPKTQKQTHCISLTNVDVSAPSQIKHHCSISCSIHLVLSVLVAHQGCCGVLIPTGKLARNISFIKASPGLPGKVWIITLSGRQSL